MLVATIKDVSTGEEVYRFEEEKKGDYSSISSIDRMPEISEFVCGIVKDLFESAWGEPYAD